MLNILQKLDKFENFLVLSNLLDPCKLRFLNSLCDTLAYATTERWAVKKEEHYDESEKNDAKR